MSVATELPALTPDEAEHSARLEARVRDEIARAGGWIGFARYMQMALYEPGLGYYSAGARKLGAAGDFVTAPEVAPVFSRCLAAQCEEVLRTLGGGDVSLIDMFPTLLELCGLPAVNGLQGRSLVPLMQDPLQSWQYPVLTTYLKNHHAIRLGKWCYMRYENGDEELYDRSTDQGQFTNLAGRPDLAGVKEELGRLMPALIA